MTCHECKYSDLDSGDDPCMMCCHNEVNQIIFEEDGGTDPTELESYFEPDE